MRIDSRAWVWVNLGRNSRSPGVFEVFVPAGLRAVVASDLYSKRLASRGSRLSPPALAPPGYHRNPHCCPSRPAFRMPMTYPPHTMYAQLVS
eukprot:1608471-Pleurochrysis_carterae.AAC.1